MGPMHQSDSVKLEWVKGTIIMMNKKFLLKNIFLYILVISPFMYLTGISLEMNIFHLVVSMLAHISGSECPIFTFLVSLERFRVAECPSCRVKT